LADGLRLRAETTLEKKVQASVAGGKKKHLAQQGGHQ
jgi:hypothetical protein